MGASVTVPRVLFSAAEIHSRVTAIASDMDSHLAGRNPVLVGILGGALPFLADLARALVTPCQLGFLFVKSRQGKQARTPYVLYYSGPALQGRDVVLVEDVIDTGATLQVLETWAREQGASRWEVAACVMKPQAAALRERVRWAGFWAPEMFLVGYGMDLDENHRHLPHIAALPEMEQMSG